VSPTQTVFDGLAPQAACLQRGSQLLAELTGLLESPVGPAEFYGEFLQRVVPALNGIAGWIWTRTPHDDFQLEYQLHGAAVGVDQGPHPWTGHTELLRRVARENRPIWLASCRAANLTDHAVVLAPIVVDDAVAGVLEIWQKPGQQNHALQTAARDLAMVACLLAAYLHKTQWRQLQEQQQLWGQLEAFARQIHGSLDAREVAYLVANECRRLVGCDQVSVGLSSGRGVEVEAISGATSVEKRSRVVQAMRNLLDSVMTCGEKLVYAGSQEEALPPAVRQALDAYLAQSNSRLLVALPLHDRRVQAPERTRAVLLVESFQPAAGRASLECKLEVVAPHAASALHNAVTFRQVSASWLSRGADWLRGWMRGKRWRKTLLVAGLALLLIGSLTLIPAGLRLDVRGQLLPRERQMVYAQLHGKVVELKVQHGDRVERGQELLFMEDLESQLKVDQLGLKVGFAEQRLALLGEQIAKAASADERNALIKERINQEYELRKAVVERDILLQGSLNPRKAAVLAPLAGKVVTFDTREQLVGKTVKPGDSLMRLARVDGPWEIELLIPEARIAPLRDGLQRAAHGELRVDLLLASHPLRTFQGLLRRDGLGGETTIKDNAVVLPVRVQVADSELASQLHGLPVGLEIRAKVHCGQRSLGVVWFGDLVEFFYEHLWF
jgi:multidrug efflux pump subunit AcrA (membrane-fusion protein)